MKKILSILMILVLVGGVAFAQTEASYSGKATLSWGIDLGSGKDKDGDAKISHGFKNTAEASVTLPFVKKGSGKAFGEGDIYAFLNISGAELGIRAARKDNSKEVTNTPSVYGGIKGIEAKVFIKKFYISIYNAPKMSTSYAQRIVEDYKEEYMFNNGFKGYGTKIGYADKDMYGLDVGVKFVSNGSWEDRDKDSKSTTTRELIVGKISSASPVKYEYPVAGEGESYFVPGSTSAISMPTDGSTTFENTNNVLILQKTKTVDAVKDMNGHYGFGIDFSMEPVKDYLKIDAGFNMTFDKKAKYQKGIADIAWDDSSIINFGVKLTSSPINNKEEKEALTFDLGFDGGTNYKWDKSKDEKGSSFAWALGFGAVYTKPIVGIIGAGLYVGSESTPYGRKTVYKLNPSKQGSVDMAMRVMYAGLFLEDNLDVHASLDAYRLLSKINETDAKNNMTIPMIFNLGLSYKADKLAGKDYMWIMPYGDIWGKTNFKGKAAYQDYTDADGRKKYFVGLAYKLGVKFQPMEKLVLDACWEHGELDEDTGTKVTKPMNHNAHNGTFILSATISY